MDLEKPFCFISLRRCSTRSWRSPTTKVLRPLLDTRTLFLYRTAITLIAPLDAVVLGSHIAIFDAAALSAEFSLGTNRLTLVDINVERIGYCTAPCEDRDASAPITPCRFVAPALKCSRSRNRHRCTSPAGVISWCSCSLLSTSVKPAISSWAASVVNISVMKCSAGSPFSLIGSSGSTRLGHVHFVAGPLLGLLIGIMRIGIMRVLYRARRPHGWQAPAFPRPLRTARQRLAAEVSPLRVQRAWDVRCIDPLKQLSDVLPTLPVAVGLLGFA